MPNNPQHPKIILFDHAEKTVQSGGVQYLTITDLAGEIYKISDKRQTLWAQFENAQRYEGFVLVYENYKNIEYIADAYSVASKVNDQLLKRAITEVITKLGDQQNEERNRSQALAYAKDILCAGKIEIENENFYKLAQSNYLFIKGQWKPQVKEVQSE